MTGAIIKRRVQFSDPKRVKFDDLAAIANKVQFSDDTDDIIERRDSKWDSVRRNFIKKKRRGTMYKELKTEKNHQFALTVSLSTCYISLILIAMKFNLNQWQVGGLISGILTLHFFAFFYPILYDMEDLHHVRIKRKRSSLGGSLFLPYDVEMHKELPLASVSALIGLRGSNAEKLISSLGFMIIAVGLMTIALNIIGGNTNDFYTNMLMICSLGGHWLIISWQLEYTFWSDVLHYLGVASALSGGFISFMVQQKFSTLSLSMTGFGIFNGLGYLMVLLTNFKDDVHHQSKLLLVLETALFSTELLCVCSYLFCLSD